MTRSLSIIPIGGLPEIRPGDDLAQMIIDAGRADPAGVQADDVLVVSQKVVSKAENRLVRVDPDDPLAHKPL
ncbi:MAG: coenzyme F420-0:L-glutamate ligase, partial [Acidimicrobiia bacterium]|nr:coenzyme F420-0:L-glutamate ligase [Acidimicrobiia bacterium]